MAFSGSQTTALDLHGVMGRPRTFVAKAPAAAAGPAACLVAGGWHNPGLRRGRLFEAGGVAGTLFNPGTRRGRWGCER